MLSQRGTSSSFLPSRAVRVRAMRPRQPGGSLCRIAYSNPVAIPRYPDDITAEWLSTVLSNRGTPVRLSDVDVTSIGTGQTGATYRISATYAGDAGSLPDTFVIKLPAQDDTVRDRVVIGYRSECAFYTGVADRVRVPIPQCFYCEISDDAMDYALLLADQAPAVQGDQIAGCGEREARLVVTALAGLHGPSWCDPFWLNFPGIAFARPDEASAGGLGEVARMSAEITLDKLGDRMSAADRETFTTAMGLVTPWLLAERDRFALLHGDYRLDNLLFSPDAAGVTVVDWQTLGVGLPARDLAYFTATSLKPELRACDRTRPSRRILSSPCGLRRHRLRPRDLLAGLPTRHDPSSVDLGAGIRVRHRHRSRRRHGADHVGPRLPGHSRPRHARSYCVTRISIGSSLGRRDRCRGDVARVVTGQPTHRIGDVLGLGNPIGQKRRNDVRQCGLDSIGRPMAPAMSPVPIAVLTGPGCTLLTRIECLPSSAAKARAMPVTACLLAV